MDTKALEKFCPWARTVLKEAVDLRCRRYALDPDGLAAAPAGSDVVAGRVLPEREKAQRAKLAERIEARGYGAFCEEMAYTWFNRFAAIRYMELHDYLPSHVRMLSSAEDGGFSPDCLRQAADLDLPGLDAAEALQLMAASEEEELFRLVIVAQCNELAECLPEVFGQVDAADALTLPDGLLLKGEHDFLYHLVADIPEAAWENVEVLGWMYQFYNSELKDAFFKSKRKAEAADIAPATQLFTPEWIVRYMVENSLGRLWMLNRPESTLCEHMEYYIESDGEHEDFIHVGSPEDITLLDPACGSGHILSYAFVLLYQIYQECGYAEREIPTLILEKNLSGYEVDERAAQIACLTLALRAREHDRRFFRREVRADVRLLESIPFGEDETGLAPELADELSHLGEVGSLLNPTDADMDALRDELDSCAGDLLSAKKRDKLERAIEACEALRRRFTVVVANPPYMGSSSFNPFMSKWVKKNYPETKSDLCTCFIERGYALAQDRGYSAMVTMQSWMFLGSFEKMRNRLLGEKGIVTMAHLGPRAFDAIGGEVVSVTADVLYNGQLEGRGTYFRLVDINGSEPKRAALLEAINNPTCGWFYRADATTFHQIPGSPIAYWASEGLLTAFGELPKLAEIAKPRVGLQTSDNAKFLRLWHECSLGDTLFNCLSPESSYRSAAKWYPHNKGGSFRKWSSNSEWVINYRCNGADLRDAEGASTISDSVVFKSAMTYSRISSGLISFRMQPEGFLFDSAAVVMFADERKDAYLLALLNSSVMAEATTFLVPTLNAQPGDIAKLPIAFDFSEQTAVDALSKENEMLSKLDWDSLETSWDFKRSPLL